MLVLSRAKGDALMIGDSIEVEIVDILSDKVRLGIKCPGDIPVHRQEVWAMIQEENRKAAASPGADE